LRTFALLAALLCAGAALNGQTSQARITGRVLDPGGAVIPNVEVIATSEATGVPTRANSNEVGVYVLPFLQPATLYHQRHSDRIQEVRT
jgi:hypothetical protein